MRAKVNFVVRFQIPLGGRACIKRLRKNVGVRIELESMFYSRA